MASKRTVNTVSATEKIETQISELQALKKVVQYIENQIAEATQEMKNIQSCIDEAEASGEPLKGWDLEWKESQVTEYRIQRSALYAVLDKLLA